MTSESSVDELPADGPVVLHVRSNAPRTFRTVVRNGRDVMDADHHEQDFTLTVSDRPAAYWVDVVDVDRSPPMSWLTSNAIFVTGPAPPPPAPKHPPPTTAVPLFDGSSVDGWQVEHDAESRASVEIDRTRDGPSLLLRWSLAPGAPVGKFVTLARRVPTVVPNDRMAFAVRGAQPMRISVQLRTDQPNSSIVERWQRTVFVDVSESERTVYFDDVRSVGTTRTPQPVWSDVHAILFGIDATNTKPGAAGELWIRAPRLEK